MFSVFAVVVVAAAVVSAALAFAVVVAAALAAADVSLAWRRASADDAKYQIQYRTRTRT